MNSTHNGKLKGQRVHDKLDVFKYALASYASMTWEEVHLYYELGPEFEHRNEELRLYARELFPRALLLNENRISTLSGWREALSLLPGSPEQLIWLSCNDDHVLIHHDSATINEIERVAGSLLSVTRHVSVLVTHWQETVAAPERYRLLKKLGSRLSETPAYRAEVVSVGDLWSVTSLRSAISTQIVNKALLNFWFSEPNSLPLDLRRTDLIERFPDDLLSICPHSELVRHFDAYSHVGIPLGVVPVMMIPDGFFDGKIKLLYGGNRRRSGYVWLHPLRRMFGPEILHKDRSTKDGRCDWNITLDEIPLFWRTRISEIVNVPVDADKAHYARLVQKLKELTSDVRLGYTPRTARAFLQGGGLGLSFLEIKEGDLSRALRRAWSPLKRLRWCGVGVLAILSGARKNPLLALIIQKNTRS